MKAPRVPCDVSFLTSVTRLEVSQACRCTLTVPTSVVHLQVLLAQQVAVAGAENVTHLELAEKKNTVAACPSLRELEWTEPILSDQIPLDSAPGLSTLKVAAKVVAPGFRFPAGLTSLVLHVVDEDFDFGLLTPLTTLRRLAFGFYNPDKDDSTFGSRVRDCVPITSVADLPRSLVECHFALETDVDLAPLTNLTWLDLTLEEDLRLTFPTQLRKLEVHGGALGQTNVADVALETFVASSSVPLTQERLAALPKTLRKIKATFEPAALKDRLPSLFPLL